MYWKDNEARLKSRLKAGQPPQTVALVYPNKHGFRADGFRGHQAVWTYFTTIGVEEAKRSAEEWAQRNGLT